ncbi:MAG: class I SAM-dependent RNA methyltransferase [Rhodospirillales bacterium]|nr:class I SAM-dependent RNA methyltransferase [Rhodospirillales bacterium]
MKRRKHGPPSGPLAGKVVELVVERLGGRGDGIARLDAHQLFLPFTVPGDRVRARVAGRRGDGLAGSVIERLHDGPHRAPPLCRHFEACGGCAVQHLDEDLYVRWKTGLLEQALASQGLPADGLVPLARLPLGKRRRAGFAFRRLGRGLVLGFNARASANIVDLEACVVLDPAIVALLPALRTLLAELIEPGGTGEAILTLTENGLDLLLVAEAALDLFRREKLADFAQAHDLARLSWRRPEEKSASPVAERRPPRLTLGGVEVVPPPGAFLQASPEGERVIVAAVIAALGSARRVADLYAGLGTLTLPLAVAGARLKAVEGDAEALAALVQAIRRHPSLRIETERRDLARQPVEAAELDGFEAVVFDPPRAGALAQARELARSRLVKTAVAVSCNPATLARDAAILVRAGWRLEALTPIDPFPFSPHLEVVAGFRR